MELSFAPELIATGAAAPGDPIEELHRTDGPVTITGCVSVGGRLAWIEHDRDERLAAAGVERALEAIRAVLGTEPWALVPVISDRGSAVFSDLVGTRLLVDRMLPGNRLDGPDAPALVASFAHLGEILAQIHERRPPTRTLRPLLRRHPRVAELEQLLDRGRAPQPELALERLQEAALCEQPRLVAALAKQCAAWEHCPRSTILHGAFCPGYVAVPDDALDARRMQLLGWYDAGFGPPAFDAGWLLGELRELAAARADEDPAGCGVVRGCGRAFLGAYLDSRPGIAASPFVAASDRFAALKIASHLVSFVRGYGFRAEPVAQQLALAAAVLDGPPLPA